MKPKLKRFLQNSALVLATFVLCFVALEVLLRLAGYGKVEVYEPHPTLYWRNKPNQDAFTTVNRRPFHVNSKGTRGSEFTKEKTPNTIRIITLGDSTTFGWGMADDQTWPAKLEEYLQAEIKGKDIEVINAGVNSWSYAQMFVYFRDYALEYDPDFVILAEANQWTQFSEQNSPDFVKSFLRRVWFKNLLRRSAIYHYFLEIQLRDLYTKARARFIPVDAANDTFLKEQQQEDPAAFFQNTMEDLIHLARTNDIQPIIVFLPNMHDFLHTNNLALKAKLQATRKLDVPFVDLRPEIRPRGEEVYLEGDLSHFTEEGNEIIARKIAGTMLPMLK